MPYCSPMIRYRAGIDTRNPTDDSMRAVIGMIIGGFSVLVGGFGVANIMFVSVRERTPLIGIKKALGAKRVFILLEFLLESIILCLIGCVIGLVLVYGTMKVLENALNFAFVLSMKNVLIGVLISTVLGVPSTE